MGNRERGEIEIQALGRVYTQRLDMNGLISLCEKLGLEDEDMHQVLMKLAKKIDTPKGRRLGLLYALKAHHPEITEEEVGQIITEISYPKSGQLIIDALRWAMPESSGEKGEAGRGKGDDGSPGETTS